MLHSHSSKYSTASSHRDDPCAPFGASRIPRLRDRDRRVSHDVARGAVAAGPAAIGVLLVGLAVPRPLSQVPENTMKYAVGVMLTTFGSFWAGEGAGVAWPGSDASLIALLVYVLGISALLVSMLKRRHAQLELVGAMA